MLIQRLREPDTARVIAQLDTELRIRYSTRQLAAVPA